MVSPKKPVYLLAGGRASLREAQNLLLQIVFRESGKANPTIGYVGVANEDDIGFFKRTVVSFQDAGAGRVRHALITPPKTSLAVAQDILSSSDIVFIAGGDVESGMQTLQEKNMVDFFNELYLHGKLFFGASAGSIMLAKEWVRWRDPEDDASSELFPCLGFAPVLCDTHDEADGWQELQTALSLEKGKVTGYGIATGAGLRVSPDGKVEALGGAIQQFIRHDNKIERITDLIP
jgi:peptidase E